MSQIPACYDCGPPGAPGRGEQGAVLLAASIIQAQAGVHLLASEVVNPLILCSSITGR